jgi:PKD repeat protein
MSAVVTTETAEPCEDYYWDFGDGNSSTEENPEYFYSNSGSYIVRLIGEKCGLSDTKEITIDATSSIQENVEMQFSIYPNPTYNILHINFRDENIHQVVCKIYGLDGKLVQISEWNQNSKSISIENLPQGVYQVVLLLDNQTTISERIIKR